MMMKRMIVAVVLGCLTITGCATRQVTTAKHGLYFSTMPRFSLEAQDPGLVFIGKTIQNQSGKTDRGTPCYATEETYVYAKKDGNTAKKIVVVTVTTMDSNRVLFLPNMFSHLTIPHELIRETIDGKSMQSCFCVASSPSPSEETILMEKGMLLKPLYAVNILGSLLGGSSNGMMTILYMEALPEGETLPKETLIDHRNNAFTLKFKTAPIMDKGI